jgi:hypothetical protein
LSLAARRLQRREVEQRLHRAALLRWEVGGGHVRRLDQQTDIRQLVDDIEQRGRSLLLSGQLGLLAFGGHCLAVGRNGLL